MVAVPQCRIVSYNMEEMWGEVVVAYFEGQLPEGAKGSHKTSQSEW